MKLRVLNDSIRLRLSRPEVDQAAAEGIVRGVVRFPGGESFGYVLESSPATVECAATFSGGTLRVRLPESDVRSWAGSDAVSIGGEQRLDDGGRLDILVEKDFACLAPRDNEDDSDKFPHPQAAAKNC